MARQTPYSYIRDVLKKRGVVLGSQRGRIERLAEVPMAMAGVEIEARRPLG